MPYLLLIIGCFLLFFSVLIFNVRKQLCDLNKKLKALARKSALAYKAKDNSVIVLEDFSFDSPKTKNFVSLLGALNFSTEKTLIVLPAANDNVYLSSRNIQKTKVITADQLNTYDVLNAGKLVLTAGSVKLLEEALAK